MGREERFAGRGLSRCEGPSVKETIETEKFNRAGAELVSRGRHKMMLDWTFLDGHGKSLKDFKPGVTWSNLHLEKVNVVTVHSKNNYWAFTTFQALSSVLGISHGIKQTKKKNPCPWGICILVWARGWGWWEVVKKPTSTIFFWLYDAPDHKMHLGFRGGK